MVQLLFLRFFLALQSSLLLKSIILYNLIYVKATSKSFLNYMSSRQTKGEKMTCITKTKLQAGVVFVCGVCPTAGKFIYLLPVGSAVMKYRLVHPWGYFFKVRVHSKSSSDLQSLSLSLSLSVSLSLSLPL